jgi:hypothetical protein
MARATERISELDRAYCRQHCEDHYSPRVIVDQYLRLYERVMRE